MSNYKNLLISEPPLQVLPTLAVKIGLNEAMILQQLHYWVENPKTRGYMDPGGIKWIFNSYEEWRVNFPFWSEHTIQRTFLNLEKLGLIVAAQLSKDKYDKTKYYRIDYACLERLSVPDCPDGIPQDVAADDAKLALSLNESETTAKTTTENKHIDSSSQNQKNFESAAFQVFGANVTGWRGMQRYLKDAQYFRDDGQFRIAGVGVAAAMCQDRYAKVFGHALSGVYNHPTEVIFEE